MSNNDVIPSVNHFNLFIVPPLVLPGKWTQKPHCRDPEPSERNALLWPTKTNREEPRRKAQSPNPHLHPVETQGEAGPYLSKLSESTAVAEKAQHKWKYPMMLSGACGILDQVRLLLTALLLFFLVAKATQVMLCSCRCKAVRVAPTQ